MTKKFLFLLVCSWLCLAGIEAIQAQSQQLIIGINYAPVEPGSETTPLPSEEQLNRDLDLISEKFATIRIYQSQTVGEQIVSLAGEKQLNVVIQAWLNSNSVNNEAEIASAISIANRYDNVVGVIVGSEVLSRGDMSPEQLSQAIARMRAGVPENIPVGYSDVFLKWVENPSLAEVVDWIGLNSYGYLDCQGVQAAVRYSINQWALLVSNPAFAGEEIVLTETGWPTNGLVSECLNTEPATPDAQAQFVSELFNNVTAAQLNTFVVEFADSPWRCTDDESVLYRCSWGLVDASRTPKAAWEALPPPIRPPQPLPIIAVVSSDSGDSVNCRMEPGLEERVAVGVIDGGSVEILDRTSQEEWVQVRSGETECWIHYSLLLVDGRPLPPGTEPFDLSILDVNRFIQSASTTLCQGSTPSEFASQTWRAPDALTVASCVHNIQNWMPDATAQQQRLIATGMCDTPPSTLEADVQDRFQTIWALDNIAIAYYNLGRSLREVWQFQLAHQAFATITSDLSCAWAYDSSSGDAPFFWSIAAEAQNQIDTLPLDLTAATPAAASQTQTPQG